VARLNHPHIVTVYGAGQVQGRPYIALEYLDGQTLRQRVNEQPLALRESMRIVLAIAEALQAAHAHQILHRDLKPENVLLPSDGRPRVVDFGLAVVLGEQSQGGEVRGTPAYMSPEQWAAKPCSYATDIWSFGVLLHELLDGRNPFDSVTTIAELATMITSAEPVPAPACVAELPSRLAEMLGACLQKEAARRPSADQLVEILRRLTAPRTPELAADRCPFVGLVPFEEQDEALFFGRDDEITACVERLREVPLLSLVGPSGAGKSSLIRAGLIPRLREQGRWEVLTLRPGAQPLRALAMSLRRARERIGEPTAPPRVPGREDEPATAPGVEELVSLLQQTPRRLNLELQELARGGRCRVLLHVDQLEEALTLAEDPQQAGAFVEAICAAADDAHLPVRVLAAIRDDFFTRLPDLVSESAALLQQIVVLGRPGPAALREILCRPLEAAGYSFDEGLVEEMVAAISGEAAALPLLQFTCQQLWQRRDEQARRLRRDDYQAMGGVAGALASHADALLRAFSPQQVALTRRLLLRLVTAQGTRKVCSQDALLAGLEPTAGAVLDRLVAARLVTARRSELQPLQGQPDLELAHESLIHAWQRLARWISEGREELAVIEELAQAADLWLKRGRRADEVWQGETLREAERSIGRAVTRLPQPVRDFLAEGRRMTQRRQRRRRLLRVAAVGTLATITAIALVTALAFRRKQQETAREKRAAEIQRERASAGMAQALREGARAALADGRPLRARAKLRASLELHDDLAGRALWTELRRRPLLWQRTLHAAVYDTALSPDGRVVAVAVEGAAVQLLDARTGEPRARLMELENSFAVAFSPDGRQLAAGGQAGVVRLYDLERRAMLLKLRGPRGAVRRLSFSENGRWLAGTSEDHLVWLWPVKVDHPPIALRGHRAMVNEVRFAPDASHLFTSSADGTVRSWRSSDGRLLQTWRGHRGAVLGLVLQNVPGGLRLFSVGTDGTVRSWRPGRAAGRLVVELGTPLLLARSGPGGSGLIVSDFAGRLHFVDEEGQVSATIPAHQGSIYGLDLGRGSRLVTGGRDKAVRLWHAPTAARRSQARPHGDRVTDATLADHGRLVVSTGVDHTLRIWQADRGRVLRVLRGHRDEVNGLALGPDDRTVVSAGADHTVRLWQLPGGTLLRTLVGHREAVTDVAIAPDGRTVASVSNDKTLRLWSAASGEAQHRIEHPDQVSSVAFSPDGRWLATACVDGIRLWRWPGLRPAGRLEAEGQAAWAVSFSPDNRALLALDDRRVLRWNLARRQAAVLLAVTNSRLNSAVLSPDGRVLATGDAAGRVRLHALPGGTSTTIEGHHGAVNWLRFDRTGERLVTVGEDGTVRLWRTADGAALWRPGHDAPAAATGKVEQLEVRGAPTSTPLARIDGPARTVIVGFASGELLIWAADRRSLLHAFRLHGPVRRLALDRGRLRACSELGDSLEIDLRALELDYCALLDQLRREVPVVWHDGAARLSGGPRSPRCNARTLAR
jgi:WD40 repeat protein